MTEDEDKQNSWDSRNNVVKTFKASGKYGWLHCVIGERKNDGMRFIRLKKYLNWFGIPSPEYLAFVQSMLRKGASELGWTMDSDMKDIKITEINGPVPESVSLDLIEEIPEEFIEFMKNYPKTAKNLISTLSIEDLDDEDFKYLSELIIVLNDTILKAGRKLKLSFQEVSEKIAKEHYRGMDELSDLMENWSLIQITSLANEVKKRLNDIEMFEKRIHDKKTYELKSDNSIHRILEKSMWIINDAYWIVQSNKSLRNFIGDEIEKSGRKYKSKRPDFVCVNSGKKLIIVEIKKPSLTLKKKDLDQAELYLRIIKRYKGENYSSIKVYLVGNKISDEARELEELRQYITLKTYQDFLDNCRKRYQNYLKIIEEEA